MSPILPLHACTRGLAECFEAQAFFGGCPKDSRARTRRPVVAHRNPLPNRSEDVMCCQMLILFRCRFSLRNTFSITTLKHQGNAYKGSRPCQALNILVHFNTCHLTNLAQQLNTMSKSRPTGYSYMAANCRSVSPQSHRFPPPEQPQPFLSFAQIRRLRPVLLPIGAISAVLVWCIVGWILFVALRSLWQFGLGIVKE